MGIPEDVIERLAGAPVASQRRLAGGDISGASEVSLADGRVVVAKQGPAVAVEARMLKAMARSAAPVPEVLGYADNVLLIERRPSGGLLGGDAWESLAEALRALHGEEGADYGWLEDYSLRHVTVENAALDNWPQFWAERRMICHLPHLPAAIATRIEALADRMNDLLPATPAPALLHGDLWGGNVLVSQGRISGLIDPCAFYGDREVDAASLTVFDSPPPRFFEALAMEPGWHGRQSVYRLWMWLVHVRLFGRGYLPAVAQELQSIGF